MLLQSVREEKLLLYCKVEAKRIEILYSCRYEREEIDICWSLNVLLYTTIYNKYWCCKHLSFTLLYCSLAQLINPRWPTIQPKHNICNMDDRLTVGINCPTSTCQLPTLRAEDRVEVLSTLLPLGWEIVLKGGRTF